jgi:hypothetical protein
VGAPVARWAPKSASVINDTAISLIIGLVVQKYERRVGAFINFIDEQSATDAPEISAGKDRRAFIEAPLPNPP